jgi:hypothetical protein
MLYHMYVVLSADSCANLSFIEILWNLGKNFMSAGTVHVSLILEYMNLPFIKYIDDPHVTQQDLGVYDMILGREVLTGLGIKIDFGNNILEWNSIVIPIKNSDTEIEEMFALHEPKAIVQASDRSSAKCSLPRFYGSVTLGFFYGRAVRRATGPPF